MKNDFENVLSKKQEDVAHYEIEGHFLASKATQPICVIDFMNVF